MGVPEALELGHNSVAIAIDKGKNSQHAVQWTVDHFLKGSKEMTVVLVHVKTHNFQSQMDNYAASSAPSESEVKQLFLPYRGYCSRKGIIAYEVVLHDIDVASALISYIEQNSIGNIVVGASNHNAFTRRFKPQDVPTTLEKSAPEFCTLYVIYKGRVYSMRASNVCHMPSANSRPNTNPKTTRAAYLASNSKSSSSSGSESRLSSSSSHSSSRPQLAQGMGHTTSPYHNPNFDYAFRMQQGKGQPTTSPYGNKSYDTSSRSQGMGQSTSHQYMANYDNSSRFQGMGQPLSHQPFSNPILDNTPKNYCREGIGNFAVPNISTNSQTSTPDELDDEMRQLRLEIKKTMDLYKSSSEQAILAKQKVDHLQGGVGDGNNNIENMKNGREALAMVAEFERQKCQAAMNAAEMTERLAEMESQRKKFTEDTKRQAQGQQISASSTNNNNHNNNNNNNVSHRVYSFNEIEVATNYFSESLKIGEGGYGPVYKAILQHTPVAIKVLKPDATQGLKQFYQEIEILGRTRHPNMVLLLGACPQHGCLVYEYLENGSLEDRLFRKNKTPPIPWRIRFKIAAEIGSALLFLHEAKPEPMVHRDLKPANILLDTNYTSKIADVGLARLVPPTVANQITQYHMTAAAGTFCYIDPEYQTTGKLGTKSDVYSLGIILLQLITAKSPMALAYHVEEAIDEATFDQMLDPLISDWPKDQALAMAKLALKCCELRKKDRPDLDSAVLPQLIHFRNFAMDF